MPGITVTTTTELNMRRGPGLNHEIITRWPTGTPLELLDEVGDWLHVTAQGLTGYVHRAYVRFPRAAKTARAVSLRAQAGQAGDIVAGLLADTQLLVLDEDGAWCHVNALGMDGYLPIDVLAFPQQGVTTGSVNLRIGPGLNYRILEMLPPGTEVHIWRTEGDWYYVADIRMSGFLHHSFVQLGAQRESQPAQDVIPPEFVDGISLQPDAPLSAPAEVDAKERRLCAIWNRLGGLFTRLAARMNIEPALVVAVWATESGGAAFGADGRMIIRFENHIFFSRWGQEHETLFRQHFTFNPAQRWRDHRWRPAPDRPWQSFHGDQAAEWTVFQFAAQLDDTAAKLSISMGGPQIMGFNFSAAGFASVQAMFTAFTRGEQYQVLGFFNFIRGRAVAALQERNFEGFARAYNGPGQVATYSKILRSYYDTFNWLRTLPAQANFAVE